MNTFQPRWDVLPLAQRELWPQLAASVDLGLVLYGGTAVALRLGHRSSVDFDFFTEKPLDKTQLHSGFAFLGHSSVVQDRPDSLSVLVSTGTGSVKVSFFGGIAIGRVGVPDRTADGVLEVATLLDLLATKLKVIQQRIEAKDYLDVTAILRGGIGLEDGLAAATTLFPSEFQPSEAIKALIYFEGGDLGELPFADREFLCSAVARVHRIPAAVLASRSLSAHGQ